MSRARASRSAFVGFVVALAASLAACGGGGESENIAVPVVTQPVTGPSGTLVVTVRDPYGKPLRGATILASRSGLTVGNATTGVDGKATISFLPALVQLLASHPLGSARASSLAVSQNGTTTLDLTVTMTELTTVALLPVTIPAGGVSVDRSEVDLQFTLASAAFMPASAGLSVTGNLPTPLVALDGCYVWLDATRVTPSCSDPSPRQTNVRSYRYDQAGTPALSLTGQPYGAMVLLEQSNRMSTIDPYALRSFAARNFIRNVRTAPSPDLLAIAGFAGSGSTVGSAPLIPQLPLWLPPGTTTAFSADQLGQEVALDTLEPLVGGTAPVFAALSAAMTTTAAQVLPPRPRAVVALLDGGDQSGLSSSQRQAALAALKQQQASTGMQFVLIAGPLDEGSSQREELAELASTLQAPIIYAGYPANWSDRPDGLHTAFALAADLLSGTPLRSVQVVFRVKSDQPGGFVSGSVLRGELYIESSNCPMGCSELPQHFAVTIP